MPMSKTIFALHAVLIALAIPASLQGQDLWPIEGAAAGEGIVCKPQDYIGSELNFADLFINAGEGTDVLAPRDGIVTSFYFTCYLAHTYCMTFNVDDPDSLVFRDAMIREEISRSIGERMKVKVDPKFVGLAIAIEVAEGETYFISGLRPVKTFRTGYEIRRGEVLGKVGFAYRGIDQPCIDFSRSINTKPADPMSIFGLKSSYLPPDVKTIDYLTHKHPVEDLKEDFAVFRASLEEGHPGLYDYTPKARMDSIFDACLAGIDEPIASRDFWLKLLPVMHALRDSHTGLLARRYASTDNSAPPVLFGLEGGKVKVFRATEEHSDLLGKTVTTIDGVDAAGLIPEVENLIYGTDGYIESQSERLMLSSFWRYYGALTAKKEGSGLVLGFSDGTERSLVYARIPQDRLRPDWNRGSRIEGHFETSRIDSATAMLDINTFQLYEKDLDDIAAFIRNVSREKVGNLIVDVRDNPGGDPEAMAFIFSLLADKPFRGATGSMVMKNDTYDFFKHCYNYGPESRGMFTEYRPVGGKEGFYLPAEKFTEVAPCDSIHFGGRLIVLTNEFSISASTIFAGIAHKHGRGVIVGRETGSTYYQLNATKFASVNLDNTGLELVVPLVKEIFEEKGAADIPWGRGVIPDFEVKMSFDEFTRPEDRILDFALALIPRLNEEAKARNETAAARRRTKAVFMAAAGIVLIAGIAVVAVHFGRKTSQPL